MKLIKSLKFSCALGFFLIAIHAVHASSLVDSVNASADAMRANVVPNGCFVESLKFEDRYLGEHPNESAAIKVVAIKRDQTIDHAVAVFTLNEKLYYYDIFTGIRKTPYDVGSKVSSSELLEWLSGAIGREWSFMATSAKKGLGLQSDGMNVFYKNTREDYRRAVLDSAFALKKHSAKPITFIFKGERHPGLYFVYNGILMVYLPEYGSFAGGKITKDNNDVASLIDLAVSHTLIKGADKEPGV